MKTLTPIVSAATLSIIVLAGGCAATGSRSSDTAMAPSAADRAGVEAATANFYAALNTMFTGDAGPMKAAWSRAADTTYMGPSGGFQVGWDAIAAYWDDQAAMKLGGRVEPRDSRMVVGPLLAVVNCIEYGEVMIEGRPEPVDIRSSTVFRKENGQWKVIGHQTDLLGFLSE